MKRILSNLTLSCVLVAACTSEPDDEEAGLEQSPIAFGFPLEQSERFSVLVGVDHDPVDHGNSVLGRAQCTDYMGRGFPNCYDQHDGNDYLLNGDFSEMDENPVNVLAAADGTVVSIEDGHYDKCHPGENFEITCDGHPIIANHVIIEHIDGIKTLYWHLRKHSVRVAVGDEVRCGDVVGQVGSSGISSKPHLHFEVNLPGKEILNPYAGPQSQEMSWWAEQNHVDVNPGPGCTAQ